MQQEVTDAMSVVFVAYDKLTVDDAEELRDQLFAQGSRMRVLPKRLLKRVMQGANIDFDPTTQPGQLAVVVGADAVAPAKTVHQFAKTHSSVKIVAGILSREVLSLPRVIALAELPSREQLVGQLLSVLVGPTRGLVTVLSGAQRGLVTALKAIADAKK